MKSVIITGASGDIGGACLKKFIEKGWNVTACYFESEDKARKNIENLDSSRILLVGADISKKSDCQRIFDLAIDRFGRIDAVINNAGVSVAGLVQDITDEQLGQVIDVNIRGTYNMCSLAAVHMIKNQSGSIVNVSSMWGKTGASCEAAYSMTKAAVDGLTKALAKELGPSKIRVNAVSPGLIDTKMNSRYLAQDLEAICDETPLMRMGNPCEVADAVYYLASDEAAFITGQILGVNGGYLI